MRARLRRAGCLNRKVTQRLRTLVDPCTTLATRDIFPTLNAVGVCNSYTYMCYCDNNNPTRLYAQMGEELERMHPRLYTNVSRQLSSPGSPPFGELIDADAAPFLLHATAKELFKTGISTANGSAHASASAAAAGPDISWGKIVSLFAVCAALAVDIVRQGHLDYLPRLLESTADIIEEDLAAWIQQEPSAQQTQPQQSQAAAGSPASTGHSAGGGGGWAGLVEYFQAPRIQPESVTDVLCSNWMSVAVGVIVSLYGVMQAVRWVGDWCWHLWGGIGL